MAERSEIDEMLRNVSMFIRTEIAQVDQEKIKKESTRPTVIVENSKLRLTSIDLTRPEVINDDQ